MSYFEFIKSKMRDNPRACIIDGYTLSSELFEFQDSIVRWALRRGRAAIFADCGLGKTFMQLEWARVVTGRTNLPVLILCPLAVAQQTIKEGLRFGISAQYLREYNGETGIIVTNYEMVDHFDLQRFSGLVLDESSILKSFNGKTRTKILRLSEMVDFRLACTATPAPNDHMELGNHAQFCGVMTQSEMLASFFIHDTSGNTQSWRLKGHAEESFWAWVCTWAVCMSKPSDIGYSDDLYSVPELTIEEHIVSTPMEPAAGQLFQFDARSLSELRSEQRRTVPYRAAQVKSILDQDKDSPWLVWCHTNAEADALMAVLDDAVEIRGSEKNETKAAKMIQFTDGAIRVLVTKPSIAGFGMNWQHCHNQAWVGLTHSYESFYQAIRRSWRFGQTSDVTIHVCCADTATSVLRSIQAKKDKAREMNEQMIKSMRESTIDELAKSSSVYMDDYHPARWTDEEGRVTIHNADCVDVWREIESDTIDLHVFSPPFESLFTYSASPRDMGNVAGSDEFAEHFGYLVPEMLRVTRPGRICAVHCMNLTTTKSRDGFIGLRDFRGDIIRVFQSHGWVYHSEVTIWKDPVVSMQRTKAHGLLHATLCKDSTKSRQGIPDYLVVFRKPGADIPVKGESPLYRFENYVGESGPTSCPDSETRRYSIDVWQRYASPVWFDINQSRTLNYRPARAEKDERHICPLQLDVIERVIHLWSNPGDIVASPFMGIGSEVVSALKMGRNAFGAELKGSYFDLAQQNIIDAISPSPQISLFETG